MLKNFVLFSSFGEGREIEIIFLNFVILYILELIFIVWLFLVECN